jgi:sigma-E factor negative regulatory protein RseA
VAAARPRRQLWLLPVAAAAGFVAVTGVMVVLQQAAPGAAGFDAAQVAATPPAALTVAAPAGVARVADAAAPLPARPAEPVRLLRDARLDEYLRAHRELLMGAPAALPGGAVRTVDFESAPQR